MKKTLTALTLTSIAMAAAAQGNTTSSSNDVNSDKNNNTKNVTNSSTNSKDDKIPSLANININLPTGGAKPLSKIENGNSSNTSVKTNESQKTRKGEEISILPLPTDEDKKTSDFKIEIKKEDKKEEQKVTKPDAKTDVSNNKENTVNKNSAVNKDSAVKKSSSDKVADELNKPLFIDKKNDKKTTTETSSQTTKGTSPSSLSTSSPTSNITPSSPAMSVKDPSQVVKTEKEKKIEVKDIKKSSSTNDAKINKDNKESTLDNKSDSKDLKEKAKISAAASAATAAIIAKELPLESKDVKTEVTLDKKEPINNIQHVSPNVNVNNSVNTPSVSSTTIQKKETTVNKNSVPSVPEKVEIKKKSHSVKKSTKTVKVVPSTASNPNVALPSVIVIDKTPSNSYSISNADVNTDVLYNPVSKQYLVKFAHKDGNSFRDADFSNILIAEGKNSSNTPLLFSWVNSSLNTVKMIKSSVNPNGEYLFEIPESKGKCEAFYVTYKLADDISTTTKSIILDSEGQPSSEMDRKCDLPKVLFKEDIIHSKQNYVISTTINSPVALVDKPVKFTSTVSFEGQEINPVDLRYIVLSEDFSNFYYVIGNSNVSPALGTTFTQKVNTAGTHYFTSIFSNDKGGLELSTVKKYISK